MSLTDILYSTTLDNWVSMELNDLEKSLYNEEEEDFNLNDIIDINVNIKLFKKKILINTIKDENLTYLYNFSHSNPGFIDNETRSLIWPILLDVNFSDHTDEQVENGDYSQLPIHKDEEQAKLDINRSFTFFKFNSLDEKKSYKQNLERLITKILRNFPSLNYYQGYHDIVSVLLLVFANDFEKTYSILEKLTLFHLRDFMINSIEGSTSHCKLILQLTKKTDPAFGKLVELSSPYQSLSSILTLFSHDFTNPELIFKIWDFILSYNSVNCCIYLYVSILLEFKSEILKNLNVNDAKKVDLSKLDKDMLFYYLNPNWLFKQINDENLVRIFKNCSKLLMERDFTSTEISDFSVLKNTSKVCLNYNDLIFKREYTKDFVFELFVKQNLEIDNKIKNKKQTKNTNLITKILKMNSFAKVNKLLLSNFKIGLTIGIIGILMNCYLTNSNKGNYISGINLGSMNDISNVGLNMNQIGLGNIRDIFYKFTN